MYVHLKGTVHNICLTVSPMCNTAVMPAFGDAIYSAVESAFSKSILTAVFATDVATF